MKKILSLMCALWACMLMGFAMEVTVPGAVLDLQDPTTVTTAGWTGEIAYYLDNKVLVVSGNESYRSVGKQTWISQASVGSTSATWSKESPFKGSDYYTTASAATVNNARNIAYLITGCDSIWCYGYNTHLCRDETFSKHFHLIFGGLRQWLKNCAACRHISRREHLSVPR